VNVRYAPKATADAYGSDLPSAEVELGSTRLIAGHFSSTINFNISGIEVSSSAQ